MRLACFRRSALLGFSGGGQKLLWGSVGVAFFDEDVATETLEMLRQIPFFEEEAGLNVLEEA